MKERIKGRRKTEEKEYKVINFLTLINKFEILLLKILQYNKEIYKLPERS
jgi:hypothetical protein